MKVQPQHILRAVNAVRHFGGLTAVKDMSFEVFPGHVTGLIGPNGAGKSTMFDLITGVTALSSGDIFFKGRRVTDEPCYRRSPMGMARTFQIVRLFGGLTVLENVMLGQHPKMPDGLMRSLIGWRKLRIQEQVSKRKAQEQLEFVGLAHRADEVVGHLSLGQQRLVDIARALASEPHMLLLDEPAAGLNEAETENLAGMLARLKKEGMTVLIVEHDVEFMMSSCDRIVVMERGSKISEGTPDVVRNDQKVIAAYLGKGASNAAN